MKHAIPDDWDHETFCRFAICWPDSTQWRALLRGLVTEPARGFFWDEKTGWIKDVLADFRQTVDHNIELPEVFMACNDQNIANALSAIAQAIVTASANASSSANASANACCEQTIINQGGGYVGSITQPSTGETVPIFGTEPPKNVTPGTYPEGYESLEEYELDKCQVANLVFDGFIGSLRGLATLGVANASAVAGLIVVALVGAIVFPPALIPIAAAAIGVLSVGVTILSVVANEIEANREEWVCWLYTADSVEAALSFVIDALDLIIAALPISSPAGVAVKTICLLLLNDNTLNQLFEKTAHLAYPDADCSGCEEFYGYYVTDINTLDPVTAWPTFQAEEQVPSVLNPANGLYYVFVSFPEMFEINQLGLDDWTDPGTADNNFRAGSTPLEYVTESDRYSSDGPPNNYIFANITIISSTPFFARFYPA